MFVQCVAIEEIYKWQNLELWAFINSYNA